MALKLIINRHVVPKENDMKATKTSVKTPVKTGLKPRKATFTVKKEGKVAIYTPVNKRAHTVAKKLGKRTRLTLAELRSTKGKGTYKFFVYTDTKTLKAIR